jgi:aspartyl-tRNA(Asn)/glutamyl-tRNA(Gln) amidotransferase subunit A
LKGVVPLAKQFDTVGPLCRSVEDAGLLLAALEGTKPPDLTSADLEGRRLAILRTVAMDDLAEIPAAAFASAVEKLRDAGAIVEDLNFRDLENAMPLSGCLFTVEAYGLWRDVIEANPDAMYAEILERFRLGKSHSGPDYVAAWAKLDGIRELYARATAGFDAVILPTAPIMPPKLERLEGDHDYYVSSNLLALRNTRIGNLMGVCAMTLPTGTASCGLMLMAAPGSEERLLRLAAAAEEALA